MIKSIATFLLVTITSLHLAYAEEVAQSISYQTHYIKTDDGIKLEVIDWGGKGTPIVFLAGLALNARTFDHLSTYFTDSYRVIGITRVGHGNSESRKNELTTARLSKDIINVIDHFQFEHAIFAGHSFAGAELTYLGKHYQKRVKGLIYIDALQDLEYMSSHLKACPDVGYSNIELFEHKEHFYKTQSVQTADGSYMPFADLFVLGKLLEIEIQEGRDYTGIPAPAIAINHIPEQTKDFFEGIEGIGKPTQECLEEMNKLTYLGVADYIKHKQNTDIAAIQKSQHMVHMATPEKLVMIMKTWLGRVFKN